MENIEDEKEELKTEDNPQVSEPEEPTEPVEETQPEEIGEEQAEEAEEEEVKPEETAVSPEKELAPAEEEKKPEREVGKEEEEEVVEERFYTVPLGKAWIMPANKRAPRAMRMLKAFITKHMKMGTRPEASEGEEESEPARLIINNDVNMRIWSRGIEKPPRKIRVRVTKDKENNVTVHLAEGE
jgi:large subunit ribosomal protein L31e